MTWGTIGSAVIIILPVTESWETIKNVCLGMFTNDRLMERIEEMNLKMQGIMLTIPEAEGTYLENSKRQDSLDYKSNNASA